MTASTSLKPQSSHPKPRTLGELKRIPDFDAGSVSRSVKDEIRGNLLRFDRARRAAFSRHSRIRRYRRAANRQRPALAPQFYSSGTSRPGQEPHFARPHQSSRRRNSCGRWVRDQRRPAQAHLPRVPRKNHRRRRQHADRLDATRQPLRRKARHTRRDHGRHYRRRRSDSRRARWTRSFRRADHSLRICFPAPTAGSSASTSCPTSPEKFRWDFSTSCRKATSRLRVTRCVCRSTSCWSSPPIPRTIPREAKSSLRSRIASARKFALTIPRTSAKAWSSPLRKRGLNASAGRAIEVPQYLREIVEEIAFQAREDKRVDRRSGVSQRLPITTLESVVSSAEQRAARNARGGFLRQCRRRLFRSARHHRQDGAGIRRRTERCGHCRARADPHRDRPRLHQILRRSQLSTGNSVVRTGRRTEASRAGHH